MMAVVQLVLNILILLLEHLSFVFWRSFCSIKKCSAGWCLIPSSWRSSMCSWKVMPMLHVQNSCSSWRNVQARSSTLKTRPWRSLASKSEVPCNLNIQVLLTSFYLFIYFPLVSFCTGANFLNPTTCCPPDVNECETEEHLCDYHAACHNTQGSYMCQCDDGYTSLDSNWMGTQCMGVIYDDVEATPSIALMAVILGAVACGLFLIVMLALIVATMVQRRWQQASAVNTVLGTAIYPRLNCSDLSQFTVSPPLPSLWRSPASPTSRSGEERYQEAESCGCGWHPNSPAATRMHVCKR
uniref:EGF-like domain-containing protein n=1 Tax=Eptatretus burgeri TaxID=7764 RepID=A0A8C4WXJ1_EPTBU